MKPDQTRSPLRRTLPALTIMGGLVLGIGILGALEYRLPPTLVSAVAAHFTTTGHALSIDEGFIRPWSHLRLQSVSFQHTGTTGTPCALSTQQLTVRYHPLHLLANTAALHRQVHRLSNPEADTPPRDLWKGLANIRSTLEAQRFHAATSDTGRIRLWLMGSALRITPLPTRVNAAFTGDSLVFNEAPALLGVDVRATFDTSGTLHIDTLQGTLTGGTFTGSAHVKTTPLALSRGTLELRRVSLGEWYPLIEGSPGTLEGELDATITLHASPLHVDSLHAQGELMVYDMSASNTPLQKDLFLLLALPDLQRVHFSRVHIPFTLKNGAIAAHETAMLGDPFSCFATGTVTLQGVLRQQVRGYLAPAYVQDLDRFVAQTLVAEEDGGRSFSFSISGHYSNPRISHERATLKRAVRSVFRSLRDGFPR